jgi:hypothetical protein
MTRTCVVAAFVALAIPGLLAAAPAPEKRIDAKVRELRKAQIVALKEQIEGQWERVTVGKDRVGEYIEAIRELGEAELDIADTREAELAALEDMVRRLKETEDKTVQLQMAGLQAKAGVAQVRAARLKAEIQLEKWKKR